mmetsp:Transcript_33310/g.87335  ORF Transcript_33310/g.87335 Transcript_33310/m.87335 type:complete len:266 (-) Transcript_33310:17-814(-)
MARRRGGGRAAAPPAGAAGCQGETAPPKPAARHTRTLPVLALTLTAVLGSVIILGTVCPPADWRQILPVRSALASLPERGAGQPGSGVPPIRSGGVGSAPTIESAIPPSDHPLGRPPVGGRGELYLEGFGGNTKGTMQDRLAAIVDREAKGELAKAGAYAAAAVAAANSTARTVAALRALGRVRRSQRRHGDAYAAHERALALQGQLGATAGQFLISFTEMITDRYLDFRFEAALELLARARSTLATALSGEARALLDRMEAFVK